MEDICMLSAVFKPLIDGSVSVPAVVSWKRLDGEHMGIVKNFILFVEDRQSLAGCFVLIEVVFLLGEEGGLLHNVPVFLDNVGVAGGKALNGS